jgi:hypothetical protein
MKELPIPLPFQPELEQQVLDRQNMSPMNTVLTKSLDQIDLPLHINICCRRFCMTLRALKSICTFEQLGFFFCNTKKVMINGLIDAII